jgi:hypothetical protein
VRSEGLGKFKNSPHRVSNQQPSGLYHSGLTTTLPCAPVVVVIIMVMTMLCSVQYTARVCLKTFNFWFKCSTVKCQLCIISLFRMGNMLCGVLVL